MSPGNSGRSNEVRKTLVLSGVVHIGQGYIDSVEQDLEIRQVWPALQGRAAISPFEASEDFTHDCWPATEVIAATESDRFFSFLQGGEEVVRVLAVDPAEHVDPGSAVDETADPERTSA